MKHVVMYGRQGTGKTRNAEAAKKFFKLEQIVEGEVTPGQVMAEGKPTLFITKQHVVQKDFAGARVFSVASVRFRLGKNWDRGEKPKPAPKKKRKQS